MWRALVEHADRWRLWWAGLIAVVIHLLVLFGVYVRLPTPAPRPLVFSLQLAATPRAGGATPTPAVAAAAPVAPALPPAPLAVTTTAPQPAPAVPPPQTLQLGTLTAPPTPPARVGLVQLDARRPPARATLAGSGDRPPAGATSQASPAGVYAERWRLQMQHFATAHFPAVIRQLGLHGRLTLDVVIHANGGLAGIRLLHSSGQPLLDTAARRLILLAAPFEPFPPALRRRYDILHIERTWEFDQGRRLPSGH